MGCHRCQAAQSYRQSQAIVGPESGSQLAGQGHQEKHGSARRNRKPEQTTGHHQFEEVVVSFRPTHPFETRRLHQRKWALERPQS